VQRILYAIQNAIEDTKRKKGDPNWEPRGLSISRPTRKEKGDSMANGNNTWIIKALIGFIFSGVMLLATGVIANENRRVATDEAIRKEVVEADKKLREVIDKKMTAIDNKIEGIRTEQIAMRQEQANTRVTQMQVLTIVEGLKEQLGKGISVAPHSHPHHDPI